MKDKAATKMQRIYLSRRTRCKGIGSALMQWLEKQACLRGRTLLWLEVMDSQYEAGNFYQKQGFIKSSAFNMDYKQIYDRYKGMYRVYKHI